MHQNQEMTDFNYKNYSLEQLENWMHDAMSSGEATAQEIYDVIHGVVQENYYLYKDKVSNAYELLSLLNGNGKGHIQSLDKEAYDAVMREKEYYEPSMPPWGHSDLEFVSQQEQKKKTLAYKEAIAAGWTMTDDGFWMPPQKKDKVTKWQLPVQQSIIDGVDDYYVNFPDDLLEAANLNEGDQVEWIDNNDGSYTLRKVSKPLDIN